MAFFDFLLRVENRAHDEINRLRAAEGAQVRPDIAALPVHGVARDATQLRTLIDFRAPPGIAARADFAFESGDFLCRHAPWLHLKAGSLGENAREQFVA